MTDKVNFSIVKNQEGNIAVQSTVTSFNLDHVTQKDIVTFYNSFSQYAALDTGLLPVDGTGILTIRTAGEYTQFAYQHKPGLYHINWGSQEGARAAAYYVAQPYRIIICDMKAGNLLGARMFYSPYPITHPGQQLYHVNLPNINCKGYRGNGVGWICLYQNEDWSSLPLNERIVRFIERCSGVETYNDANMSETDGTRFYKEKGKPSYIWNPIEWQDKSVQEGYEWTLDESLWIPVLVSGMDEQSKHVDGGVPLTFADALVGDYQAYYYDTIHTKPINAIIRPDKTYSETQIMSHFVAAYQEAQTKSNHLLNNTFDSSSKIKSNIGSSIYTGSSLDYAPEDHSKVGNSESDTNDEEGYTCDCCEDWYQEEVFANDHYGNPVCEGCLQECYIYIETVDSYFYKDDDDIVYVETFGDYLHVNHDTILNCDLCESHYGAHGKNSQVKNLHNFNDEVLVCNSCIEQYAEEKDYNLVPCFSCGTKIIDKSNFTNNVPFTYYIDNIAPKINVPFIDFENDGIVSNQIADVYFCKNCQSGKIICPCGKVKDKNSEDFNACTSTQVKFNSDNEQIEFFVNKACATCVSEPYMDESGNHINANFIPENKDFFEQYHTVVQISGGLSKIHKGITSPDDLF